MKPSWWNVTLCSLAVLCLSLLAGGQTAPQLTIRSFDDFFLLGSEDIVSFQLDSDDREAVWMLQSSSNGEDWNDLVYLNAGRGAVGFGASFERRAVPGGGSGKVLFRAKRLEQEDQTYRDYLDALLRWREKGYEDYTFVVKSNQGSISYEARYTVVGGEVIAMEKISAYPEFVEPPAELTIEDLFDRVGSAIEQDAVVIDADWNAANGYPDRAFIDIALELADEERSWTIEEFIPTSPAAVKFLAARQQWEDAGLANYSFEVLMFTRFGTQEVRYTVVDEEATTAEVLSDPVVPSPDPEPRTMEYFFDKIIRALEVGAADVSVDYDARNGHPTRVSIDYELFIADEEEYWNIREFLIPE